MVDTPRGQANAMIPLAGSALMSPYNVNVRYGSSEGIVQGNGSDWFGPLNPMAPVAPPEVIGRQFDYHSATSTPENLDHGSLQDMGDQVLSTARAAAFDPALPGRAPDAVRERSGRA